MKKQLFIIAILAFMISACGGSSNPQRAEKDTTKIEEAAKVRIYSFYGRQRCRTCIAIQTTAKEVYESNFAQSNDVSFHEIDFSARENRDIAEKYEIAMSSLLITTDEGYVNLTDDAFALISNQAHELKELIKTTVNNHLN